MGASLHLSAHRHYRSRATKVCSVAVSYNESAACFKVQILLVVRACVCACSSKRCDDGDLPPCVLHKRNAAHSRGGRRARAVMNACAVVDGLSKRYIYIIDKLVSLGN